MCRLGQYMFPSDASSLQALKSFTLLLFCCLQATIAGGGVIPHIHKSLINKGTKKEGGPMVV
jgi:hypothetical protein